MENLSCQQAVVPLIPGYPSTKPYIHITGTFTIVKYLNYSIFKCEVLKRTHILLIEIFYFYALNLIKEIITEFFML